MFRKVAFHDLSLALFLMYNSFILGCESYITTDNRWFCFLLVLNKIRMTGITLLVNYNLSNMPHFGGICINRLGTFWKDLKWKPFHSSSITWNLIANDIIQFAIPFFLLSLQDCLTIAEIRSRDSVICRNWELPPPMPINKLTTFHVEVGLRNWHASLFFVEVNIRSKQPSLLKLIYGTHLIMWTREISAAFFKI